MITWIQNILQKHHKVIFTILLFVIIVAFVFTIGTSIPFFGDRNRGGPIQEREKFYGWDMNDPNVQQKLAIGVNFDLRLTGTQAPSNDQMVSLMLARARLLALANELSIPAVNKADLITFVKTRPIFLDEKGEFSREAYDKFMAEINYLPEAFIDELFAENALVDKMVALVSGPGFVLNASVLEQFNVLYSKRSFELATLKEENFNPEIDTNDEALRAFFEKNVAAYQIAPRVSLQVAFFPSTNYELSDELLSDADLVNLYETNKSKYTIKKDDKTEIIPFEMAKDQVAQDYKKTLSLRKAGQAADDFINKVYSAETAFGSEVFNKILADDKVELKKVPEYSRTDADIPRDVPVQALVAGLDLSKENWMFKDIISDENGAWVVFLESVTDVVQPALEDVKEKVIADFKASERDRLFTLRANTLSSALQAGIKDGKSFEDIANEAGASVTKFEGINVETATTYIQQLGVALNVMGADFLRIKANEVSQAFIQGGSAFIVNMKSIETLQPTEEQLANIKVNLSQRGSMSSFSSFVAQ